MSIYKKIHAVMREVSYLQKERKAGLRFSVVSHDAVTRVFRAAFLKHGVVAVPSFSDFQTSGNRTQCTCLVRYLDVDAPESFVEVQTYGFGVDPQDKGPGKAMSYAFKYNLLKAFGVETGDDPDLSQDKTADYDPRFSYDPEATAEELEKQEAPDGLFRYDRSVSHESSKNALTAYGVKFKGRLGTLELEELRDLIRSK